jgi:hypothetical protein
VGVRSAASTRPVPATGWRALLNGEPDEPTFVSVFCAGCAEREFGPAAGYGSERPDVGSA